MFVCLCFCLSVNQTSQNEWTDSAAIVHAGFISVKKKLINFWKFPAI